MEVTQMEAILEPIIVATKYQGDTYEVQVAFDSISVTKNGHAGKIPVSIMDHLTAEAAARLPDRIQAATQHP
jgi:hypothetical protein